MGWLVDPAPGVGTPLISCLSPPLLSLCLLRIVVVAISWPAEQTGSAGSRISQMLQGTGDNIRGLLSLEHISIFLGKLPVSTHCRPRRSNCELWGKKQ